MKKNTADRLRITDSSVVTKANGTGGDITLGNRDADTGAIDPFVIVLDTAVPSGLTPSVANHLRSKDFPYVVAA